MKLQRITALLWRGEVYEGRSVLFVPVTKEAYAALRGHPIYRELHLVCRGIDWHKYGCMELLIKVFHDAPEDLWVKAKTLRVVFRHLHISLRHVTTMHYLDREPKSYHCTHNHFTHRPIARAAKP